MRKQWMLLALLFVASAEAKTKFGLHMDLTNNGSESDREAALRRAQMVHAQLCRNNLFWQNIEPEPGDGKWKDVDAALKEQIRAGLEPLLTVVGSPAWASGANPDDDEYYLTVPTNPARFRTWVDRYAQFAQTAARRYRGRVKKWELWNEENEHFTWKPKPDADQYVTWYRAVYAAIKSVDPSVQISIGGLTGLEASGPTDYNGNQFLQALFQRGLYPDFIAIHPYAGTSAPDAHVKWSNNFTDVDLIHRTAMQHGQGNTPIWLTEWGWDSKEVGEVRQATYVTKALQMISTQFPYVTVAVYFLDMDRPPRYYHGLYDAHGRLKQAGVQFRDFVSEH